MSNWGLSLLLGIAITFIHLFIFTSTVNAEVNNLEIHIVEKGESLWEISQFYGVDFKELLELNTHFENVDLIYPKNEVIIPNEKIKAFFMFD